MIHTVLLFWIYIFLLTVVLVLQCLLFYTEILIIFVSVFLDFPSNSQEHNLFHHIAYDYSCADWDSLHVQFGDIPLEDIFKLSCSAAAREFCE